MSDFTKEPPLGVVVPMSRQSSVVRMALRDPKLRDGAWHRVGDPMGGTTAEQYARRYNAIAELPGVDVVWRFGYKSKGDTSELWVKWIAGGEG